MHHVHGIFKIRAVDIHLIDVSDTGNFIFIRLSPYRFALGFHAALGAERRHGAVQNAQGTFDFDGEVHVSRRIDDVDVVTFPLAGRGRAGDRDTAFLFLDHPVHGSRTFVDFAQLMRFTGIEQNSFGRRRLARVDMRHDADVSGNFQTELSWHNRSLESVMRESPVRFRHSVRIFLFLHGCARVVIGVHQFAREFVAHISFASLASRGNQPADGKRLPSFRSDLDRNLIVRAADSPRFDFDHRHDVVDRLVEDLHGFLSQFGGHLFKRIVNDALRDALFAVQHNLVDDLGHDLAVVYGIG